MNKEPSPETRKGKYNSVRDELLHLMTSEAWGTDSDGSTDSPYGWFALCSNQPEELHEIRQAFEDVHPAFGGDLSSIVGSFVLVEDEQGFVTVRQVETEEEARAAFQALREAYAGWLEAGE